MPENRLMTVMKYGIVLFVAATTDRTNEVRSYVVRGGDKAPPLFLLLSKSLIHNGMEVLKEW